MTATAIAGPGCKAPVVLGEKESLRTLLALARTGTDCHRIGQARYKLLT